MAIFKDFKTLSSGSTEFNDGGDGGDGGDGDGDGDGDGEGELIEDGPAPSLDYCDMEDCTECAQFTNNKTSETVYQCKDFTQFRYQYKCWNKKDRSLCGSEDLCHFSWPHGDPDKKNSEEAACRPIPSYLIANDFKYSRREVKNSKAGLCRYG